LLYCSIGPIGWLSVKSVLQTCTGYMVDRGVVAHPSSLGLPAGRTCQLVILVDLDKEN
jgi:hypothetical protein